RLADAIDAALKARSASQQPVRIIAHSMGGLLARTVQLERKETWQRIMSRPGARFLMLGTPNGGSFAPRRVLAGATTVGNLLSAFGSLFDAHTARQIVAGMPGLMQLQAGLVNGAHQLDRVTGWSALADADFAVVQKRIDERSWWHRDGDVYRWGVPTQD